MKPFLLFLLLAAPLFGEEALGIPIPSGFQVIQTNIEGTAAAHYISSAPIGSEPAFYFLVIWGKFSSGNLSEGMPENIGGTQLIFNTPAKNIDSLEFIVTGKSNTNIVFKKLELSNGAYKKSENEFDMLELINVLGEDTNSYSGISLTFYQGKKVVDKQTLSEQEIIQLKKVVSFGRSVLTAMMKEWMMAASEMIKKSMPQIGESTNKSTLRK